MLCFIMFLPGALAMLSAQNLIENYSFETLTTCPNEFGGSGPTIAPPWEAPTVGTPDIFNDCATSWTVDVPTNFFGEQVPVTGVGYCGFYCRIDFSEYREYIQAPFGEPLTAGEWYYISFYVSLADNYCAVEHIGAYISVDPPGGFFTTHINQTPQIESNIGYLSDDESWVLIDGCFQAEGGESFITIGNFRPDSDSPIDPDCGGGLSYFFCDDVMVLAGGKEGNFTLDLGDPVTACFSYEIDPGISGYTYTWEDGSHDPTFVVTESGFYALSISDECYYAEDSIEVTILGNAPPVDLGPDEITICNGDVFNISLNPELSEYTWQDGSNNSTFEITTAGVYSVTLDDGCSVSSDQIIVDVFDPISPFLFDDDVYFCSGEGVDFDFDPALGDFLWHDGSTSSSYSATSEGVYSLTITNVCGSVTDEVFVQEIEIPEVELGPFDQEICAGDFLDLVVDLSYGDVLWQDNSTESTYTVTGGGLYAVTISNQCGEASDEVFFMEVEVPLVYLGPEEQTICEGDLLEFDFDPDLGNFIWQDGSTQSFYEVNSAGSYSVEVTNACGEGFAQIDVSVLDPPSVNLGSDTVLCLDESLLLSSDQGANMFLWQDNSTSNEFLVSSSGVYTVTVSNFCGNDVDSIAVDYFDPLNTPNLGPDISLCPGEQVTLLANIPDANYIWSDLSTEDSLVVTGGGTYHVLVYNTCQAESDTVIVSENDSPPVVNLQSPITLCQGNTITLDAAISGVTYLWSNGSVNQQLIVSAPGTYSVTVSNACGADVDTVIVLDGGAFPAIDLGADINLCAGDSTLLTPDSSNIETWLWQDGSMLSSFIISDEGEIYVEVANGCGMDFDTINATLLPNIPLLDLGADTTLCPGESVALNVTAPGVDILWSDGSIGPSLTTSGDGLFFASITNSCGSSFDTMEIVFLPDIPTLDLGPDQSLCPGETVSVSPGINNVSYEWHDGSTQNFYETTQEEEVILTITNACGSSSDTLLVFENSQGPQVDLGPDILACVGDIITIPAGVSGVDYLWQDGSISSSFTTTISGEFILQVSNNCGLDADTIRVDIHGSTPVVDLGPDTSLCEGVSLLLISTADVETLVEWQDGSSQISYTVAAAGTYSLFESNHCGDATDTVLVSFIEALDMFNLGPDTLLCPGESITLTAPDTAFDLLWQDGSSQSTLIANQEETYWLQLSNQCGVVSDSLNLSIDNNIPVLNLANEIPWCAGDVITLDVTQPFNADYLWSNGAIAPSIDVSNPNIYSVIVSTLCRSAVQDIDVFPGTDCVIPEIKNDIYIPNVFSPNGDGVNDFFMLSFGSDIEITSMEGSIFDRWGNLVYSSAENSFQWDGLFAGESLQPGVYVYLFRITFLVDGIEQEGVYSGDITLIR